MNKTGFGFLRLPQNENKEIDYVTLNEMVDLFIQLGGTYFDTAYTYLNGKSEEALRKAVVERYPREKLVIADKLPGWQVKSKEENETYFQTQLDRCGVDYFDVYLIHWLNDRNYEICEKFDQFGFLSQLKAQGKAKKIGFSYHDSPELLDEILRKHQEVDIVQLQINYLDWDSPTLKARELYEVAKRHNKQVVVMEPVKGGTLANVPDEVKNELLKARPQDSIASWAIRFVTSLPKVDIVLSGMNTQTQMIDNMNNFEEMSESELTLLNKVAQMIRQTTTVPCTKCGYCLKSCPRHIPIPEYFELYNDYARNPSEDWKMEHLYFALKQQHSPCIECHICEKNCPQKIKIPTHLKDIKNIFE